MNPIPQFAAQNAPGSGITFDFGGLSTGFDCYNTGDIRFCNLYIRNTITDSDGIAIGTANNIVERCTFELCRDEGVGITGENARNNIIAYSRFESCGSQPGDGTGYANGRRRAHYCQWFRHPCRKLHESLLQRALPSMVSTVSLISGITWLKIVFRRRQAPVSQTPVPASNTISNVSNDNATVGFAYKNSCTFYRSGNTGTGNSGGLQSVEGGCTEMPSVITVDDTPFPSWLNDATTPTSGNDVGKGTGLCQCLLAASNYPPVVNAGNNQTIISPAFSATLNGTVTDDGLTDPPGAVTTQWTKQSGPGPVTFGDTNAVDTTATFSPGVYGTYVLRLTASDSEFIILRRDYYYLL